MMVTLPARMLDLLWLRPDSILVAFQLFVGIKSRLNRLSDFQTLDEAEGCTSKKSSGTIPGISSRSVKSENWMSCNSWT